MSRELTEFEKFEKCVKVKQTKDRVYIDCVKGLWSVESSSLDDAVDNAKHYFLQYLSDGEYSSVIGGKNVVETLLEKNK